MNKNGFILNVFCAQCGNLSCITLLTCWLRGHCCPGQGVSPSWWCFILHPALIWRESSRRYRGLRLLMQLSVRPCSRERVCCRCLTGNGYCFEVATPSNLARAVLSRAWERCWQTRHACEWFFLFWPLDLSVNADLNVLLGLRLFSLCTQYFLAMLAA